MSQLLRKLDEKHQFFQTASLTVVPCPCATSVAMDKLHDGNSIRKGPALKVVKVFDYTTWSEADGTPLGEDGIILDTKSCTRLKGFRVEPAGQAVIFKDTNGNLCQNFLTSQNLAPIWLPHCPAWT